MPGRRRSNNNRQGGPQFFGPSGTLPLTHLLSSPPFDRGALGGALDVDPGFGDYVTPRRRKWQARPPQGSKPYKGAVSQYSAMNLLQAIAPAKVRYCVQRKQRREVLFARRKAGYAGSAPKRRYRRTQSSLWRC